MGCPQKIEKQIEKWGEAFFSAEWCCRFFFANFPCPQRQRQTSPKKCPSPTPPPQKKDKNPAPLDDSIKNADQVVLQIHPICLCEQQRGSLEKRIFLQPAALHPSSHHELAIYVFQFRICFAPTPLWCPLRRAKLRDNYRRVASESYRRDSNR